MVAGSTPAGGWESWKALTFLLPKGSSRSRRRHIPPTALGLPRSLIFFFLHVYS